MTQISLNCPLSAPTAYRKIVRKTLPLICLPGKAYDIDVHYHLHTRAVSHRTFKKAATAGTAAEKALILTS